MWRWKTERYTADCTAATVSAVIWMSGWTSGWSMRMTGCLSTTGSACRSSMAYKSSYKFGFRSLLKSVSSKISEWSQWTRSHVQSMPLPKTDCRRIRRQVESVFLKKSERLPSPPINFRRGKVSFFISYVEPTQTLYLQQAITDCGPSSDNRL